MARIQRVQDRQLILGGLGAVQVRHGGGGGYIKKVLGYSPVAYWPLNETSGSTAYCHINSAQNGTYTNVTLNDSTSPTGVPCPYYPGVGCDCDILTDAVKASFDKTAGTMMVWFNREDPPGWQSQNTAYVLTFDFFNGGCYIEKAGAWLLRRMFQGATVVSVNQSPGPSGWTCQAITWDLTPDEFKVYADGVQQNGTQTGLPSIYGAMDGAHLGWGWQGWLAHAALWDRALSSPELLDLATV